MSAYALPGLFPPVDNSFGVCLNSKPILLEDFCPSFEEKVDFDPLEDCPCASVSVKEARVDPVLLIQSLTAKNRVNSQKRKLSYSSMRSRHGDTFKSGGHHPTVVHQESAMEFELDVQHNGRRYTVVRSLARIRQLHCDLVKETEIMTHAGRRRRLDKVVQAVPSLPRMDNKEGSSLGFTLLQDVLRCYSPTLEAWFQQVLADLPALPMSPCLADFLYEPLYPKKFVENLLLPCPRKACPARLDSIEESDSEDEEKDQD